MLRIGLSANFLHADPERALYRGKTLQYFEERMALSVAQVGALPVLIPELHDAEMLASFLGELDGVVLSGGADVSPSSYGEAPLRPAWVGDKPRDDYESSVIRWFIENNRPVLGVCRGIQILNVALGGTLWQDIAEQVPGALVHRDWHQYDELGHAIRIEEGSWLSRAYGGATKLAVNTIHHQALQAVAPALRPTAWAPDGIVEAAEHRDRTKWVVGVQWHPEWLEPERVAPGGEAEGWADGTPIFAGFVQACEEARTHR